MARWALLLLASLALVTPASALTVHLDDPPDAMGPPKPSILYGHVTVACDDLLVQAATTSPPRTHMSVHVNLSTQLSTPLPPTIPQTLHFDADECADLNNATLSEPFQFFFRVPWDAPALATDTIRVTAQSQRLLSDVRGPLQGEAIHNLSIQYVPLVIVHLPTGQQADAEGQATLPLTIPTLLLNAPTRIEVTVTGPGEVNPPEPLEVDGPSQFSAGPEVDAQGQPTGTGGEPISIPVQVRLPEGVERAEYAVHVTARHLGDEEASGPTRTYTAVVWRDLAPEPEEPEPASQTAAGPGALLALVAIALHVRRRP